MENTEETQQVEENLDLKLRLEHQARWAKNEQRMIDSKSIYGMNFIPEATE